jgi:hypothetical protein
MGKSLLVFNGFISLLVGAAIFALLFVIILKALREVSFFKGQTAVIVAMCASLLSVIGLFRFFGVGDVTYIVSEKNDSKGTNLDIILIPYATLAVAILVMLLLLFLSRIFRKRREQRCCREFNRGVETRYPFERSLGTCEKSEEKSHIRKN